MLLKQQPNGQIQMMKSHAIILQLSDSFWNLDDVKFSTPTKQHYHNHIMQPNLHNQAIW